MKMQESQLIVQNWIDEIRKYKDEKRESTDK
jgi:hypothetical protein